MECELYIGELKSKLNIDYIESSHINYNANEGDVLYNYITQEIFICHDRIRVYDINGIYKRTLDNKAWYNIDCIDVFSNLFYACTYYPLSIEVRRCSDGSLVCKKFLSYGYIGLNDDLDLRYNIDSHMVELYVNNHLYSSISTGFLG